MLIVWVVHDNDGYKTAVAAADNYGGTIDDDEHMYTIPISPSFPLIGIFILVRVSVSSLCLVSPFLPMINLNSSLGASILVL